jgi:hypothetical protein
MVQLSRWVIDGDCSLTSGLLVFTGASLGYLSRKDRGGNALMVAGVAFLTLLMFGLTAGCTMKSCGTVTQGWNIAIPGVSPLDVSHVCIDERCETANANDGSVSYDYSIDSPTKPPTGMAVRVSSKSSLGEGPTQTFWINRAELRNRAYLLKVTLKTGRVITKRVRPHVYYCNGKRCGPPLYDFSFTL